MTGSKASRARRIARFNLLVERLAQEAPADKKITSWPEAERKSANQALDQFKETAAALSDFAAKVKEFKQVKEVVAFMAAGKPVLQRLAQLLNSF